MDNSNTAADKPTSPRFVKSAELLDREVEVVFIDEVDSDYGPEYLFDIRLSDGEIVSYSRHRDEWRRRGVEAMQALLDAGEPCLATLRHPGKALIWDPYDMRGRRMSTARASKLRQLGLDVTADDAGGPQLRMDDAPPYTDEDAPTDDDNVA
jgi:hypothetical protein